MRIRKVLFLNFVKMEGDIYIQIYICIYTNKKRECVYVCLCEGVKGIETERDGTIDISNRL